MSVGPDEDQTPLVEFIRGGVGNFNNLQWNVPGGGGRHKRCRIGIRRAKFKESEPRRTFVEQRCAVAEPDMGRATAGSGAWDIVYRGIRRCFATVANDKGRVVVAHAELDAE